NFPVNVATAEEEGGRSGPANLGLRRWHRHSGQRRRRRLPARRTVPGAGCATSRAQKRRAAISDPGKYFSNSRLERGLYLEAPSFQKRLRDVLGILVAARPLPQTGGAQILVGGELVLAHDLFKLRNSRDDRPNRLRLAPVWISASLRHERMPFVQMGDSINLKR